MKVIGRIDQHSLLEVGIIANACPLSLYCYLPHKVIEIDTPEPED